PVSGHRPPLRRAPRAVRGLLPEARRRARCMPRTTRHEPRGASSLRHRAPRRRTWTTRALAGSSLRFSFALRLHRPPQRLLGAQDQHADVVARHAERGGDLVVARVLEVGKHERDPVLVGERCDRGLELGRPLRRDQRTERRGFFRIDLDALDVLVSEELRLFRSAPDDVDAVAARDGHDPRGERLRRIVAVECAVGAHECLLSGVVGRVRSSEQLPAQAADAPIVAAVKLLEIRVIRHGVRTALALTKPGFLQPVVRTERCRITQPRLSVPDAARSATKQGIICSIGRTCDAAAARCPGRSRCGRASRSQASIAARPVPRTTMTTRDRRLTHAERRRRRRRRLTLALGYILVAFAVAWYFDSQATTTVVFVRHADVDDPLALERDPPLNAIGRARADLLSRFLEYLDVVGGVNAIYAAPYRRAEETAAPLADR